jgi:hypothetical protein
MSSKEEENIYKEAIKIINSNKQKASTLRNTILSFNQNTFTSELHFQIMEFLGEFEYDLKTLMELMNDFKNKIQSNHKKNINTLKKELTTIKKENISFKELLDDIKINKSRPLFNKNKNKSNTRNQIQNTKNKNLTKTQNTKNSTKQNKNEEKSINYDLYPCQLKKENTNQNSFYSNQINITNNKIDNKPNFYDYNTYLSTLKHDKSMNFIKYDTFKKNNKKDLNEIARGNINNSVRAKSVNTINIYKNNNNNIIIDEVKKQKIINEIFQDEKVLNVLKNQFGNDIEDKLLNEEVSYEFLLQIENIANNIKKCYYYTPKNYKARNIIGNNIRYNLKIPKRYSNSKNNNSLSNLIIT